MYFLETALDFCDTLEKLSCQGDNLVGGRIDDLLKSGH